MPTRGQKLSTQVRTKCQANKTGVLGSEEQSMSPRHCWWESSRKGWNKLELSMVLWVYASWTLRSPGEEGQGAIRPLATLRSHLLQTPEDESDLCARGFIGCGVIPCSVLGARRWLGAIFPSSRTRSMVAAGWPWTQTPWDTMLGDSVHKLSGSPGCKELLKCVKY